MTRRHLLLMAGGVLAVGLVLVARERLFEALRADPAARRGPWRAEATASDTIVLTAGRPVRFETLEPLDRLRLLSNLLVPDPPPEGLHVPYVLVLRTLDDEGEVLFEERFHELAAKRRVHDPAGRLEAEQAFVQDGAGWTPADARRTEVHLGPDGQRVHFVEVLLAAPVDGEALLRIRGRRRRTAEESEAARRRLARRPDETLLRRAPRAGGHLRPEEIEAVTTWAWPSLPPVGLPGTDYRTRTIFVDERFEDRHPPLAEGAPFGEIVEPGRVVPIDVEGPGFLRLVARPTDGLETTDSWLQLSWLSPAGRREEVVDSIDDPIVRPVPVGLATVEVSVGGPRALALRFQVDRVATLDGRPLVEVLGASRRAGWTEIGPRLLVGRSLAVGPGSGPFEVAIVGQPEEDRPLVRLALRVPVDRGPPSSVRRIELDAEGDVLLDREEPIVFEPVDRGRLILDGPEDEVLEVGSIGRVEWALDGRTERLRIESPGEIFVSASLRLRNRPEEVFVPAEAPPPGSGIELGWELVREKGWFAVEPVPLQEGPPRPTGPEVLFRGYRQALVETRIEEEVPEFAYEALDPLDARPPTWEVLAPHEPAPNGAPPTLAPSDLVELPPGRTRLELSDPTDPETALALPFHLVGSTTATIALDGRIVHRGPAGERHVVVVGPLDQGIHEVEVSSDGRVLVPVPIVGAGLAGLHHRAIVRDLRPGHPLVHEIVKSDGLDPYPATTVFITGRPDEGPVRVRAVLRRAGEDRVLVDRTAVVPLGSTTDPAVVLRRAPHPAEESPVARRHTLALSIGPWLADGTYRLTISIDRGRAFARTTVRRLPGVVIGPDRPVLLDLEGPGRLQLVPLDGSPTMAFEAEVFGPGTVERRRSSDDGRFDLDPDWRTLRIATSRTGRFSLVLEGGATHRPLLVPAAAAREIAVSRPTVWTLRGTNLRLPLEGLTGPDRVLRIRLRGVEPPPAPGESVPVDVRVLGRDGRASRHELSFESAADPRAYRLDGDGPVGAPVDLYVRLDRSPVAIVIEADRPLDLQADTRSTDFVRTVDVPDDARRREAGRRRRRRPDEPAWERVFPGPGWAPRLVVQGRLFRGPPPVWIVDEPVATEILLPADRTVRQPVVEPGSESIRYPEMIAGGRYHSLATGVEIEIDVADPQAPAGEHPIALRLLFDAPEEVGRTVVVLDGIPVLERDLHARRGLLELGKVAPGRHRIRIDAPRGQFLVNQRPAGTTGGFFRLRTLFRVEPGDRFVVQVDKDGPEAAALGGTIYFAAGAAAAGTVLRANIARPADVAAGPSRSVTSLERRLRFGSPDPAGARFVHRPGDLEGALSFFVPLGDDLPAGRHAVELTWTGPTPVWMRLYRIRRGADALATEESWSLSWRRFEEDDR